MAKQLALYVSASPEMDAECELLGQLLAGMFHSTGWDHGYTWTDKRVALIGVGSTGAQLAPRLASDAAKRAASGEPGLCLRRGCHAGWG